MIVKFFPHTGVGRPSGAVDYVMSVDRDEAPVIIQGCADFTRDLCLQNKHKHKYTSGVLSWEKDEVVTPEMEKEIIADFENTAFCGLDKEQYNCLWVRHTDKGRHELHFVSPRLELTTRKSFNMCPPIDQKTEFNRYRKWQRITNFDYGFSDPDNIALSKSFRFPDWVTKKGQGIKATKENIIEEIEQLGENGTLRSRDDVIAYIKGLGFEIEEVKKKHISVKHPDYKRNIRLKGSYVDGTKFQQGERGIGRESDQPTLTDYDRGSAQIARSIPQFREDLKRANESRSSYNRERFPNRYFGDSRTQGTDEKLEQELRENEYRSIDEKREMRRIACRNLFIARYDQEDEAERIKLNAERHEADIRSSTVYPEHDKEGVRFNESIYLGDLEPEQQPTGTDQLEGSGAVKNESKQQIYAQNRDRSDLDFNILDNTNSAGSTDQEHTSRLGLGGDQTLKSEDLASSEQTERVRDDNFDSKRQSSPNAKATGNRKISTKSKRGLGRQHISLKQRAQEVRDSRQKSVLSAIAKENSLKASPLGSHPKLSSAIDYVALRLQMARDWFEKKVTKKERTVKIEQEQEMEI